VNAFLSPDESTLRAIDYRNTLNRSFLMKGAAGGNSFYFALAAFRDLLRVGTSRENGQMFMQTFVDQAAGNYNVTFRGYIGAGIARPELCKLGIYTFPTP
jgi:hypothetical protein